MDEHDRTARRPVLVLDAYALVYRSFFALPAMNTSTGEPTSALYGFCSLLIKLLREQRPCGAAVAVDTGRTFRHDRFAGYKAGRAHAPAELSRQLARLPELWAAFGFPSFGVVGFEADDVCATLARLLRGDGETALVATADLDALQCIRHGARVLVVGRGAAKPRIYDEAAVRDRFGVEPRELPDWKALAGDATDAIAGAPGIGAKTATTLVKKHGTVADMLAHLEDVEPEKVRVCLREHGERLLRDRDICRLRDDVPLPAGPRFAPFDAAGKARVRALFEALELRSLLARVDALSTP